MSGKFQIDNAKAQMKKGVLEYCILKIISQGEAYATDILVTLKRANLIVVEGTLYPLLTRLKNENLLTYKWVESKSGPPRKYYQLTADGELFLQSLDQGWKELNESVMKITSIQKTTI